MAKSLLVFFARDRCTQCGFCSPSPEGQSGEEDSIFLEMKLFQPLLQPLQHTVSGRV
jgi:hypothetical protein